MAVDRVANLHLTGDSQCLPLYRYTEDGERVSNITRWGIDHINGHYRQEWGDDFQALAGEDGITAEEIFAYTYAVLHNPAYRTNTPWTCCGSSPACPCTRTSTTGPRWDRSCWTCTSGSSPPSRTRWSATTGRTLIRSGPSCGPTSPSGTITLDERTTLAGVPEKAWEYRLGSRSALEWVLDQYKERKPRDPTIREKFNNYRFSDHKERVIDLLRRVCTVSAATMEIVDSMAQHEALGR